MRTGVLSAIILGAIVWDGLLAIPTVGDQPAGKREHGKGFPDLVAALEGNPRLPRRRNGEDRQR
jgi:hypothetical protein